jgi:hypothetical protein
MCGVSAFKTTAQVAYYASSGAALLVPNAWPAVSIIYEGQGDPDQILHAAQDWWKVNDKLGEVMRLSQELRASLDGMSWAGDDRQAYEDKLADYERQCMWSGMHAAAISMSLFAVMAMLMVFIAMMAVVAAILVALALYVIAMYVASFFTAGASAAAAQAKANIIAGKCYAVLKTVATTFETIMRVAAGVITGLFTMGVGVLGNALSGNWMALADLGQGMINSIDDLIAGSLGKLEQSLTSGLMKGRLGGQQLFTWTIPTQTIPRSARPWVAPIAGAKGGVDTGVGDPFFSNLIYGQREYGDDYVDRTHPGT